MTFEFASNPISGSDEGVTYLRPSILESIIWCFICSFIYIIIASLLDFVVDSNRGFSSNPFEAMISSILHFTTKKGKGLDIKEDTNKTFELTDQSSIQSEMDESKVNIDQSKDNSPISSPMMTSTMSHYGVDDVAVRLERIWKVYDFGLFSSCSRKKEQQPWVLKNINLAISDGEILCILGPNGAGKTTLIG